MSLLGDFLIRIRAHTLPGLEGFREGLLAVAERVNRRTQIFRLHWQSSSIMADMTSLHTTVGRVFVDRLAPSSSLKRQEPPFSADRDTLERLLADSSSLACRFRKDLLAIEDAIRDLETENLSETLLHVHRDLAARSATIARVPIPAGSPFLTMTPQEVERATGARIGALFRGPALLPSDDQLVFRPGDVMVLIGLQKDLRTHLFPLRPGPRATV